MSTRLARVEDAFASAALLAMALVPIAEILLRRLLGTGIPGAGPIAQHLVLWVGFLGAAIAARQGTLLALASGTLLRGGWRDAAALVSGALGAGLSTLLAAGGLELVASERGSGAVVGLGVPVWVAQLVLPAAFAAVALRLVWRASPRLWGRALAAAGVGVALLLLRTPDLLTAGPLWPWLVVCGLAAIGGTPIFAVLGGLAALLFLRDGVTPGAVLVETYALTTSPTLPAIPLFTLAGFLLAEGQASARLLRVFRAWCGWIPGGTAVVCAVLCSFFTVFTGGSGVTILALGGLLLPALVADGYRDRFAVGLLTASGSLGLLLPPALPLILYAIVAQMPMGDLFIGGVLPGVLLTTMMAAWGIREGLRSGAGRQPFRLAEAVAAMRGAAWELTMPLLVVGVLLTGLATAIEAAALTALYALVVQVLVHRDVSVRRDLLRVCAECVAVVGGVLIILGVAVGLTSWLVAAQVPAHVLSWTQMHVHSRYAFLLGLNLFLLVVGALMDIFSAIVVVVPLIAPLGLAYGIHPVHLGIIFIANLELGYLTPPVGLNLFLASYRFKRPLLEVTRAALPMLGLLGAGVLVITYVPWLTVGLLRLMGRG